MKSVLTTVAALSFCAATALAQNTPMPPAPPTPPAPPQQIPPDSTAREGGKDGKDVNVVAKDVKDIIGFGGRITVKDSRAKVLGGAAGDVTTQNASFETVLLAAGNVEMIGGTVNELKLAGGNITLDITVADNGTVAGGEVRLGENMNVRGDMHVKAGSADVSGQYGGDLKIDAGSARVSGTVGGDLRISARRITIEPGTKIGGDLIAPNLTVLPDDVLVGGETTISPNARKRVGREGISVTVGADDAEKAQAETKAKLDEARAKIDEALREVNVSEDTKDAIRDAVKDKIVIDSDDFFQHENDGDTGLISPEPMGMQAWFTVLVTLAACGALALGIAPQFLVRATERLAKEPLPSFGVGAASLIAVPALLIAVSITIIGIPFAILGAAAYVISIGLGLIALCLWGGLMVRTLANQPGQETRLSKLVGWTLMGFLALALIGAVPFIGRVVQVVAIITGAGAVLSTAWALRAAKKAHAAAAATT
jgi:cytoskeletal protein CcmA (bactofilin family)